MKEEIETIRQACIKANPEIVELTFGCEYTVRKNGMVHKLRKEYLEKNYCGECREGQMSGQAFRDYKCGYCKKSFSHPNTGVPRYCNECAEKHKKCRYCACPIEIIGRPIRLADIIFTYMGEPEIPQRAGKWAEIIVNWDLLKDDLTLQSPETITFLANLLSLSNIEKK